MIGHHTVGGGVKKDSKRPDTPPDMPDHHVGVRGEEPKLQPMNGECQKRGIRMDGRLRLLRSPTHLRSSPTHTWQHHVNSDCKKKKGEARALWTT